MSPGLCRLIRVALFYVGAILILWPIFQALWDWKKPVAIWAGAALACIVFVPGLSFLATYDSITRFIAAEERYK
jgi:hypothetical protein